MFLRLLFCTLLFATTSPASAQLYGLLTGTVIDGRTNMPVSGAAIRLLSTRDTTLYNATSEPNGSFRITMINELGRYVLSVEKAGYAGFLKVIETRTQVEDAGRIILIDSMNTLREAVVSGRRKAFTVKGDTVEYDASYYKTAPDMDAVYLINKMPGIDLRSSTANGDTIRRYSINGMVVFNQDALRILSQLPAGFVERVQVMNNPDDSMANGSRRLSPSKALNVQTKSGYLLAPKGKGYGGYGTDHYFLAGGNLMQQKGSRQLTLDGSINRGRIPYGSYYEPSNIFESQGISLVSSLSAAYSDDLSKKDKINLRYSLNHYSSDLRQQELYEYDLGSGRSYTETRNDSRPSQLNHSFQGGWTRQLSEKRKLQLTGRASLTNGDSKDSLTVNSMLEGRFISNVSKNYRQDNGGSLGGGLAIISKSGKRYSSEFRLYAGYSDDNREGKIDASVVSPDTVYTNRSTNSLKKQSQSGSVSYSANIIADSIHTIVAGFRTEYSNNLSAQNRFGQDAYTGAYSVADPEGTTELRYGILLSSLELKDIARTKKSQIELVYGLEVQRYETGRAVGFTGRNYHGLNPFVEFKKKFSGTKTLSIHLRKRTEMPSYSDLNPLINTTNSSFYKTGNPDLMPSPRLDAGWSFRSPFTLKSSFFNVGSSLIYLKNRITESIILPVEAPVEFRKRQIPVGVLLQYTDNGGDFYSGYGWIGMDAPLPILKLVAKLNTNGSYTSNTNQQNGLETRTNTLSWTGSLTLSSVLSEKLDYSLYGSYVFQRTSQESVAGIARDLHNWRGSALLKIQTFRRQSLRIEGSVNYVSGLASSDKTRFYLVDVFYSFKFLKDDKLTCTLLIHDLFDSYRYFSYTYNYFNSSFTQNAIYTSTANGIRRYGLVMVSYAF